MSVVTRLASRVRDNVGLVMVGKTEVVDYALVGLLAEGHILLEDVPGIGKTTLAKALARSIGCSFRRIQFTPDLLPSDVTGITYYDQKRGEFEYRPGPIHANIVLADEVNRATPRTQSSLLEAMQERQVTVDGETRVLPRPFLVLATQNPIELEGTFPLPEAQLDRFMLRLSIGYPSEDDEAGIAGRFEARNPLEDLEAVVSADEVMAAQSACRSVYVADVVRRYVVQVVRGTRQHGDVRYGASPRATIALTRACQALAAIGEREFVLPDDVKRLAPFVLCHRLVLKPQALLKNRTAEALLREVLDATPVPVEEVGV